MMAESGTCGTPLSDIQLKHKPQSMSCGVAERSQATHAKPDSGSGGSLSDTASVPCLTLVLSTPFLSDFGPFHPSCLAPLCLFPFWGLHRNDASLYSRKL